MNGALFDPAYTGAVFSECRKWRYRLWRIWDYGKPPANFLMLNPSRADEFVLDPTVTRCMNYARAWGHGGLIVTNLFAWRATDPEDMKAAAEPIGEHNDHHILRAAMECAVVVCAWGNDGSYRNRAEFVRAFLRGAGVKLRTLRINGATGQPAHPLYLPKSLTPMEFP